MKKKQPIEELDLSDCPFCGSNDWDEVEDGGSSVCVQCQTCGAFGPSASNLFNAVRLWNLRND